MKVAFLTSQDQWFVKYAKELNEKLKDSILFYNHEELVNSYDIYSIYIRLS